jgi:AraC-like DNA-binding protein
MAISIIVIALIHAYIFAFLFFKKKKLSSTFLGLYMINFFLKGSLYINFYNFEISSFYILFYIFIGSTLVLDFPIIYMYVKKMVERDYKKSFKHLLHFLPAVIILILQLISILSLSAEDRNLLMISKEEILTQEGFSSLLTINFIALVTMFIQMVYYSSLMIYKLIKHKKDIEHHYSYKEQISLNWLLGFVIFYLLYYLIEVLMYSFESVEVSEVVYFSIVSLHIFFVGILGLRQRDIYIHDKYINPEIEIPKEITENTEIEILLKDETEIKTSSRKKVLLDKETIDEIGKQLHEKIEKDKLYLNPELSLDDLANQVNIYRNYVSYVINEYFQMNFYKLINHYRIEEAKKMLLDDKYDNLSIEGIAKSVGFKTRNVFYPIFKSNVGLTPLMYKKSMQNKSDKE